MVLLITPTLNLLLLIFGNDELTSKPTRHGEKCPSIHTQPNFDFNDILGKSYFYNYRSKKGSGIVGYRCFTLQFRREGEQKILKLTGFKALNNEKVEQEYRLKRDQSSKPGHYEVEFTKNGATNHGELYVYYRNSPTPILDIILCIRIRKSKRHAVGALISTNKQRLHRSERLQQIAWLQQSSGLPIRKRGVTFKNKCRSPSPEPRPRGDPSDE